MIESGLFFVFGFLTALLLALIIAPAIWRRAVFLTRKRIESAVPLTVNELVADKDRLRAEHALEISKLHTSVSKIREKSAGFETRSEKLSAALGEAEEKIGDMSAEIASLQRDIEALSAANATHEDTIGDLTAELQTVSADRDTRGAEIQTLEHQVADLENKLTLAREDLEKSEFSLAALRDAQNEIREKRREANVAMREATRAEREANELLSNEKKRSKSLETKLEKSIAKASDLEEKIARKEKDVARLREELRNAGADMDGVERQTQAIAKEREALDKEVAALNIRLSQLSRLIGADNAEKGVEALKQQIVDSAAIIDSLSQERDSWRAKAETAAKAAKAASDAATRAMTPEGDKQLREEMNKLAAEVIHMAALIDGPDSDVLKILRNDGSAEAGAGSALSLADRVAHLRKIAAERQKKPTPSAKL